MIVKHCLKCGSWMLGLTKTNSNYDKTRFHDFMTCQKCQSKHVFIRYAAKKDYSQYRQ